MSRFNDINLPFSTGKMGEDSNQTTATTTTDDAPSQNTENCKSEYSIKCLKLIVPPEGIRENSAFDFEGEIELHESAVTSRLTVDVKTTYKDLKENDDIIAKDIEVTFDNEKFRGTCRKFFYNHYYQTDMEKTSDAVFKVVLIARGKTAEKEFESEEYTFPMKTQVIVLKRGHYDDNWVKNFPDKCKTEGEGYIKGDAVLKLQQKLVRFRILDKRYADGDFGEKTEKAVKDFQDYAKKPERIKMKDGLLFKIDKITYSGEVDGVVEEKTQNEITLWYQEEYVRPVPNLYHKDFDENWKKNGARNAKEEGDFHQGTPVTDLQKRLRNVGAYQDGREDGHFFDKTKAELIRFQEAASKGEFLNAANEIIKLADTLIDFVKGIACPGTQDYLKMIEEKGLKVPEGKCVRKGDKGLIVEEINIRLAGFGGGVPTDTFDDLTETKVKNFQRDYMKMQKPTGVVDVETAKAIDEFGEKYRITATLFEQLKCNCGVCSGFGKKRHKNEFKTNTKLEMNNQYEYPGIHRSLLWAVSGLAFHLIENKEVMARFLDFSSGYRCHDHGETKKNGTTNHMGKAVDIRFNSLIGEKWIRPAEEDERNKTVEAVRKFCTNTTILNAQYKWFAADKFSMETTDQGAKTWLHLDVREFQHVYLDDTFFSATHTDYFGTAIVKLIGGVDK